MTTSRSVQFIDPDPKMAIAWPATRPCGLVTECIIMKKTIAALDDLLLRHPRSVGETYGEHATIAIRFAMGMIGGGVKCLVHAIIPGMRSESSRVGKESVSTCR